MYPFIFIPNVAVDTGVQNICIRGVEVGGVSFKATIAAKVVTFDKK